MTTTKITLKTLSQATEQQVFDQVAAHLLTQGVRSIIGAVCMYRGPDNNKCAVGCLIGDDEYEPEWEGAGWTGLMERLQLPAVHFRLIASLQVTHDEFPISCWPNRLREIADIRGLNADVVAAFSK